MLQRIQSIWLLLAAGFDAITFKVPFYNGDYLHDEVVAPVDLNAQTTLYLTIISVVVGLLAFATIFLFGNRKLQLRLVYLGIFLSLALLAIYLFLINEFNGGTVSIWAVFYFAMAVAFILAARGIRADEKLIRSMNRFR
jgi:hypothetical protein